MSKQAWAALLFTIAFSTVVLGAFYDRTWFVPDEGSFAYMAWRVLEGDVLHRDVQDIHPGLLNFFHAGIFLVLGESFLSLRQALVALGVIEAGIVFLLLRPRGLAVALTGSMALPCVSLVMFPFMSPNWHGLFLFLALVGYLVWAPVPEGKRPRGQWFIVGLLLGLMFGVRHATGVFVGAGVLTWLLLQPGPVPQGPSRRAARGVVAMSAVILGGLTFGSFSPRAALLLGAWPLVLMIWSLPRVRTDDRTTMSLLGHLGGGFVVALLPLVAYHLYHGSFAGWFEGVITVPLLLDKTPNVSASIYERIRTTLFLFWNQPWSQYRVLVLLNQIFLFIYTFCIVPLSVMVAVWWSVRHEDAKQGLHPLVFLLPFYALVALIWQHTFYYSFIMGVSLAVLLWVGRAGIVRCGAISVFAALPLLSVSMGMAYNVAGQAYPQDLVPMTHRRVRLLVHEPTARVTAHLVQLVEENSLPHETLLAVNVGMEFNFIAQRKSPARYFELDYEALDEGIWSEFLQRMRSSPPRLVIIQIDRTTRLHPRIIKAFFPGLKENFRKIAHVQGYQVWRCDDLTTCGEVSQDPPG